MVIWEIAFILFLISFWNSIIIEILFNILYKDLSFPASSDITYLTVSTT